MENLIRELKAKIVSHRGYYESNEAAVRRQLIEPILDHIGWRTDDPNLVKVNSQTEERDIPDYTY